MNPDSYDEMLSAVQAFHDKHDFKNTGGEELTYRVALMSEELGGTAIAADFDLKQAFWEKMEIIMKRESKIINGRIRVSEFRN
jgi:hypothetical protein